MTVPSVIKYGIMAIMSMMFIMSQINDLLTGHDRSLEMENKYFEVRIVVLRLGFSDFEVRNINF